MIGREKKMGRRKYENMNIFRTKKDFLMKKKMFFIVFKGLSFGENKKLIKNSGYKL